MKNNSIASMSLRDQRLQLVVVNILLDECYGIKHYPGQKFLSNGEKTLQWENALDSVNTKMISYSYVLIMMNLRGGYEVLNATADAMRDQGEGIDKAIQLLDAYKKRIEATAEELNAELAE